ncbi:MAG: hypothetical protein ACE5JG_11855, partial [Planctomycetota bacterium]
MIASLAVTGGRLVSRVDHVAADGLYVDSGSEQGLRGGEPGIVRRDGREIARVEVVASSARSARVRVVG